MNQRNLEDEILKDVENLCWKKIFDGVYYKVRNQIEDPIYEYIDNDLYFLIWDIIRNQIKVHI